MSTESTLRLKVQLPCGHTLAMTARLYSLDEGRVKDAGASLEYWLQDRMPRHRCELVSTDNPGGLLPKQRAKEPA